MSHIINFPVPVLRALSGLKDPVNRGDFSVTELIDSPRVIQLLKRHKDKLMPSIDDAENYSRFLGEAVHHYLSTYDTYSLDNSNYWSMNEYRTNYVVNGVTVSGAVDRIEGDFANKTIVIYDYKVSSVWSYIFNKMKPKAEWIRQLNLYRYLILKDFEDYHINNLYVVQFFRDWNLRDSRYERDYPKSPIILMDIPVWNNTNVENYFNSRLDLHMKAATMPDHDLPYCTEEETWEKKTQYAIYRKKKDGSFPDRASKLYDFLTDAMMEAYPNGVKNNNVKLEERKGDRVRCNGYCPINIYCNQYARYKNGK